MHSIKKYLIGLICTFLSVGFSFAQVDIDPVIHSRVDMVFGIIKGHISTLNSTQQLDQLKGLMIVLQNYKFDQSTPQYSILRYLIGLLSNEVERLQGIVNSSFEIPTIKNVDMAKVRGARMSRYNDVRKDLGRVPYVFNRDLDKTAYERSEKAKSDGFITHKRSPTDGYYNYEGITKRFADRGLTFKNVNRATFSENIGRNYYNCSKTDCTQDLINAIRPTFDMYMREKSRNGPHYASIVKSEFRIIGLGIAIDYTNKKYFLTVHYGTDIIK